MTTFTELQCFNKLLLDKMNRQEKEIKKLKEEQQRQKEIIEIYDSLEIALNEHAGYWDDEIRVCAECEKYKGFDEMKEIDDEYYCEDCYKKIKIFICDPNK